MNDSLVILGRQPALGLAELERLYGADSLRPVVGNIAVLTRDASEVDFDRLGGTVKLAKVLATSITPHGSQLCATSQKPYQTK